MLHRPRKKLSRRAIAVAVSLWVLLSGARAAEDPPAAPDPLADSVRSLYLRGRAQMAEPLLERALSPPVRPTRRDSLRHALWTELLAEAQWRTQRAGVKPESLAERAVTLRRALHGEQSGEVARALATQARVWRYSRSTEAAVLGLQLALRMREHHVAGADTVAADMLVTLGIMLRELNRPDEAIEALQRAVSVRKAALGNSHREVARALINLARAQEVAGLTQAWISSEREAIEIFERAHPLDSLGLYIAAKNHVSHLFGVERWPDAGPYLARWFELADRLYPGSSGEQADLEVCLGTYHLETGNRLESRRHYDRCGAIFESGAEGHQSYKEGLYWLNRTYLEQADDMLDSARACAERAVAVLAHVRRGWPTSVAGRAVAVAYNRAGQVLALQDSLAAAQAALTRASSLYEEHIGPEHSDAAYNLEEIAAVRMRMGERDSAAAAASRAAAILSRNVRRHLAGMTEDEAIRYRGRGARLAIDVLLSLSSAQPDSSLVHSAWEAVLQDAGLVAAEITSRQHLLSATRDTHLTRWAGELVRVRARLSRSELRAERDPARDSLRAAARGLEVRLAQGSAQLARDFAVRDVSSARVAAALPKHARLVQFVRFRQFETLTHARADRTGQATDLLPRIGGSVTPAYAVFVLSPGRVTPRFVPLGPALEIERELERWRSALAGGRSPDDRQWAVGRALRRRLWDPLVPFIAGAELVLVVPDGPLALAPWITLPSRDDTPLLERGPTLHLLNSTRDLLREPPRHRARTALIVGGVDYDAKPPVSGGKWRASAALRGRSSDCLEFAPRRHEPLPGSAEEARRVARTWARSRRTGAELLSGAQASESRVRAGLSGRGLVHLATHGYYVPDSCVRASIGRRHLAADLKEFPIPAVAGEALLRSGLVLAGANAQAADPEDDGILTAADLALLDLEQARLVVLSACESGSGRVVNAEGAIGLRWALMQAGARATLTTCHRVSDEATSRWMEHFYEEWLQKGLSVPEAVRAASRRLRFELRERTGEDRPGQWGAFISAGDWR